ncbi:hypothetical protein PoB_000679300 [Plakobranchus ocellatus]|uniref:Uncharacterized protein n=1 Tax=Plakobranchus ocellatus TaxID=259542 RepID=A0AAV3YDR5_9GAST|nr:hypothetical protein PoB_000679300 [Plakobranchus ocellatus]
MCMCVWPREPRVAFIPRSEIKQIEKVIQPRWRPSVCGASVTRADNRYLPPLHIKGGSHLIISDLTQKVKSLGALAEIVSCDDEQFSALVSAKSATSDVCWNNPRPVQFSFFFKLSSQRQNAG